MKFVLISLLFVLYSQTCVELIFVNKPCESYNVTNNTFDLSQFTGKWYEVAKYGQKEKCATDFFNYIPYANRANVTHYSGNTQKNSSITIEQTSHFSADLIIRSENDAVPAKMLSTDYSQYGIIWSCRNVTNTTSNQMFLVLGKKNTETYENIVKQVMNATGLSHDGVALSGIDHSPSTCNRNFSYHNNTNSSHTPVFFPGRSEASSYIISVPFCLMLLISLIL